MINIFKKTKKQNYLTSSGLQNANEHWHMLLRDFFILLFLLVLYSLYLLYQIRNDQASLPNSNLQTKPAELKQNLLKNVTESFDKKANNTKNILENSPSYKDPSL